MLASLFDAPDCQMMMVAGDLRILILTRDIPLRDVPGAITESRIRTAVRILSESMHELWGVENPRIAVAAVNPHAGDGGFIGSEEKDVLVPALEELSHNGYNVSGPYPADTLFQGWRRKDFDAFVAMYHDQGMIPFKMGGFEQGVNITLGLPVVRTSVCHGTAFDIVGQGAGDPGSLEAAFDLAVKCCLSRKKEMGTGG
jgi:4-hydroxythreonine-4-phosphate dehydrogenase